MIRYSRPSAARNAQVVWSRLYQVLFAMALSLRIRSSVSVCSVIVVVPHGYLDVELCAWHHVVGVLSHLDLALCDRHDGVGVLATSQELEASQLGGDYLKVLAALTARRHSSSTSSRGGPGGRPSASA